MDAVVAEGSKPKPQRPTVVWRWLVAAGTLALMFWLLHRSPLVREQLISWSTCFGSYSVPYVRQGIHDTDRGVQQVAYVALHDLGSTAVEPLRVHLRSSDEQTRREAATDLSIMGRHAQIASEDLIIAMRDESKLVRAAATLTLGMVANDAKLSSPPLLQASRDPEATVRTASLISLGRIDSPAAIPRILELLRDEHPQVRIAAIGAIASYAPLAPEGGPVLQELMRDEHPGVRNRAEEIFERHFAPQVVAVGGVAR